LRCIGGAAEDLPDAVNPVQVLGLHFIRTERRQVTVSRSRRTLGSVRSLSGCTASPCSLVVDPHSRLIPLRTCCPLGRLPQRSTFVLSAAPS
jgi:hypothetical protein